MQIGRYTVIDRLAIGGWGELFRARLTGDPHAPPVVIKRLLPQLKNDADARACLQREADLSRRFSHANLVHLIGAEQHHDDLYLVLEYIDGPNVGHLVDRVRKFNKTTPLQLALFILEQAFLGLHFAHELKDENGRSLNLVHRDINPKNVVISYDGRVVLVDFGIAQLPGLEGNPQDEKLIGKLGYLAPEQISGEKVDRQADVFACGVMAFEVLAGVHPFVRPGDSEVEVAKRTLKGKHLDAKDVMPGLDQALYDVLHKALEPKKKNRFGTVEELRAALLEHVDMGVYGKNELIGILRTLFRDEYRQTRLTSP